MDEHHKLTIISVTHEPIELTLQEISALYSINTDNIIQMINLGILNPDGNNPNSWHFDTEQLIRLKRALRLQHDLELDLSAVALALQLLDELEDLRDRVNSLEHQLRLFSHD